MPRCIIFLLMPQKKPYSIDRNIWGISIEGGYLREFGTGASEDAYMITKILLLKQAMPNILRYISKRAFLKR